MNIDRLYELATLLAGYHANFMENYQDIKLAWKEYFDRSLLDIGLDQKSIDVLFTKWEMGNWRAMHIETSEYKDHSKNDLYRVFTNDLEYISDRISLDRIFRNHWLYRQIFYNDIWDEYMTSY